MLSHELKRLKSINRFLELKFQKEDEIRRIVSSAATLCGVKFSSIMIIDVDHRSFFYSSGIDFSKEHIANSLRELVDSKEDLVVVEDVLLDDRLFDHSSVKDFPHIRFYASTTLRTHDGQLLGSLCLFHDAPMLFRDPKRNILRILANQIVQLFELECATALLKEQLVEADQNEIRLKFFFESKHVQHLFIDTDFKILSFNAVFADFVEKRSPYPVLNGEDIRRYIHPSVTDSFNTYYQKAVNGETSSVQVETMDELGTMQWSVHYAPVYDSAGTLLGVSCDAIDISNEFKQGEQLRVNEENFQKICDIQSHRLRGPVSSILSMLQIWKDYPSTFHAEQVDMLLKTAQTLDEEISLIISLTDSGRGLC